MRQRRGRGPALRSSRWEEARSRLEQAELALDLSKRFPARASPWMMAYAQDVRALLEALGEEPGAGDESESQTGGVQ